MNAMRNQNLRFKWNGLKDLLIGDDRTLGDRMNIFLFINSVLLIGYAQLHLQTIVIPVVGLIINLVWGYVAQVSLSSHKFWHEEIIKVEKKLFGNWNRGIIWKKSNTGRFRWSSTESIAVVPPLAFILIWIYLLIRLV